MSRDRDPRISLITLILRIFLFVFGGAAAQNKHKLVQFAKFADSAFLLITIATIEPKRVEARLQKNHPISWFK
jgi:hypothetical protein